MKQEALKLALEALEELHNTNSHWWQEVDEQTLKKIEHSITASKEALAQPEQEPVAWATKEDFYRELERELERIREEMKIKSVTMRCKDYDIALPIIGTDFGRVLVGQVSAPPQRTEPVIDKSAAIRIATALGWTPPRTWVDLTDEEIDNINYTSAHMLAKEIEAKLKEKNT